MRSLRGSSSLRRGTGEWSRWSRSQAELAASRAGEAVSCAALEPRQLLSTVYAISDNNVLLEFDSQTPSVLSRAMPITGLGDGEVMATIAMHPVTEQLYGIPSGSRTPVYTINRMTGAATRIGPGVPFGFPLNKANGLAFDELNGFFRYVDESFGNYRIDASTGQQLRNDAGQEGLAEIAYSPLNGNPANFGFFGVNHMTDQFMQLDPERMTVLSTGGLGVDTDRFVGLDIASDGTTYIAVRVNGVSKFGTISTGDGHSFVEIGAIGNGTQYAIRGLAVEPRRQAPTLNDDLAPALGAIDENNIANTGTRVRDLIDSVAPASLITDANPGALRGIAITGVDASVGLWQYSLNGGATWTAIGAPSNGAALLLGDGDQTRIRLVPSGGFDGLVVNAINFRAWDQTTGVQGQRVSTTANGGTTAFSTASVWASIRVRNVALPPAVVTPGGTLAIGDKQTVAPFAQTTITYPDNAGQALTVDVTLMNPADGALTDASLLAAGFAVVDAATGQYRFVGNAAAATAAIRQLLFKPTENIKAVGEQTLSLFRVVVSDHLGLSAQGFSPFIAAISTRDAVAVTAGAIDLFLNDRQTAQPFAQALITTVDVGAGSVTVDVTVPAGAGSFTTESLSASGFAPLGDATGTFRYIGSAAGATAALRGLVFVPRVNASAAGSTWNTRLGLSVTDGVGAPATTESGVLTIQSLNDRPTMGGIIKTNKVRFGATIRPMRTLTIGDVDPSDRVTVTVKLSAPKKGAFTAFTLRTSGFRHMGNGKYVYTGTAAAATNRVRKLKFAWAGTLNTGVNHSMTVRLTVRDVLGAQLVNTQTKVSLLR